MPQIIDLGKIRFDFQGVYSASAQYERNDVVKYGGSTYVYTNAVSSTGNLPTNTSYWSKMTEGVQFENSYSASTQYQVSDVVRYGSQTYVAKQDTLGNDPENTTYWDAFTQGLGYRGSWSASTVYYPNDVVSRGAIVYIATEGHTSGAVFFNDLDAELWEVLTEGQRWRSDWATLTSYLKNDLVTDNLNVYIALNDHTSGAGTFSGEPGDRWELLVPGADYLPAQLGNEGKLLSTDGTSPLWVEDIDINGAVISGETWVGPSASAWGTASAQLTNPIAVFRFDNDSQDATFAQVAFSNADATSSTDIIAYMDNGNDSEGWMGIGIAGSEFDDATYGITGPGDGYIFHNAIADSGNAGNMVIATGANGTDNKIIFAAGGFDSGLTQMEITPNQNVNIEIETVSTSPTTGALTVVGGVGTQGDLNVLGNINVQGSQSIVGNINIQGSITVAGGQFVTENLSSVDPLFFVGNGNEGNEFDLGFMTEAKQPSASVSVPFGSISVSASTAVVTTRSYGVVFKAIDNNVATITLNNNHDFIVGNQVTLTGVDATFNGTHEITAITNNQVSFALVSGNVSETGATGTAQASLDNNSRVIIPGDFITLSGTGSAQFNGVHHITAATATTMSFATTAPNMGATSLPAGTVATRNSRSKYSGLAKDNADGAWYLFSNLEIRPTTTIDFNDPELEFDRLKLGAIEALGDADLRGTVVAYETINVFASTAARDAVLTAPVNGTYAYRTDAKVQEYYTGSKWEAVEQVVSPLLAMALL